MKKNDTLFPKLVDNYIKPLFIRLSGGNFLLREVDKSFDQGPLPSLV
jgi:hypothetical protein